MSIHHSGNNEPDSLIDLNLKSAYVLIRNVDMRETIGKGLHILFDSENHGRISEASVTQNQIS